MCVGRDHTPGSVGDGHGFAVERLHALEDARLRLGEREQLCHLAGSVAPR
jgi:hypothetical protein